MIIFECRLLLTATLRDMLAAGLGRLPDNKAKTRCESDDLVFPPG